MILSMESMQQASRLNSATLSGHFITIQTPAKFTMEHNSLSIGGAMGAIAIRAIRVTAVGVVPTAARRKSHSRTSSRMRTALRKTGTTLASSTGFSHSAAGDSAMTPSQECC